MKRESDERADSLSMALAQRIDAVCMRFEAGWQAETTPRLEDFLAETTGAERHELLRELLRVELDWRQQREEQPSLVDYLSRFPDHASLLREVLASRVERPESSAGMETRDTVGGARSSGGTEVSPSVPGYEVGRLLGRGGMGVVYEAVQVRAGRRVALKLLRGGAGAEAEERDRFRREVEAAAGLRHAGIVQVYEVGDHGGVPWFSMELCEAGSLADYLRTGPLPPADAAALVETLACAMHQAHQAGILHRDLKPANILFSPAGATTAAAADEERPALSSLAAKVADFGLARKRDTGGHTRTGVVVGTPSYMAPEQASGRNRELGPACDTYALGAILYECLTGRPPFQAATALDTLLQVISDDPVPPARLNATVPRDLETICLKCLHKEPNKRYASALELAEELRRFLAGEPIVARPAGWVERLWKWARRRPTLAAVYALLVVVLGLGAGGGGVVWLWREALHLKEEAEKAQKRAEESEEAARFQQLIAEFLVYTFHLRDAQAELKVGRYEEAKELLDKCNPKLRGWEHGYLLRQTITPTRQEVLTFKCNTGRVRSVAWAFSPDGKRIVSGGEDETVKVWDAHSGREVFSRRIGRINSVVFSPDGKRIVLGIWGSRMVEVLDVDTGQQTLTPQGRHTGSVCSVAFSADGKRIASGGWDQTVKVWDTHKGKEQLTLQGHTGAVYSVAFSADGKRIVSGSGDGETGLGEVKVWDARTGQETLSLKGHTRRVNSVAFSPDGKRIASASGGLDEKTLKNSGEVKVWDAQSGEEVFTLKGHTGFVTSVAFSLDGKRIVSGSHDNTVKVWDAQTGQEAITLYGHSSVFFSVAFSPDGQRIFSGSQDGTAKVWEATP